MGSFDMASFPRKGLLFPAAGIVFWAALWASGLEEASRRSAVLAAVFLAGIVVITIGTIFAAVHHAEEIAHRIGDPCGTLVLTLAVTIIEASLIVSMMLSAGDRSGVARDTVFSVIMIVCNGSVGLCMLVGGLRHKEQTFQVSGANAYLAVIVTLAVLTMLLPNYTVTVFGPVFSAGQLVFVGAATIVLYGVFLYIQTVRHTEYFVGGPVGASAEAAPHGKASLPWSAVLLAVSLGVVIALAKKFGSGTDDVLAGAGAPPAVSGLIVALVVLLPESVAALRAAYRDALQTSLNLALGSALATIGLTIPGVAVVAIVMDKQLVLGLDPKDTLLFALTIVVSLLTLGTGRTNALMGLVHLVIFAAFLFLTFVP